MSSVGRADGLSLSLGLLNRRPPFNFRREKYGRGLRRRRPNPLLESSLSIMASSLPYPSPYPKLSKSLSPPMFPPPPPKGLPLRDQPQIEGPLSIPDEALALLATGEVGRLNSLSLLWSFASLASSESSGLVSSLRVAATRRTLLSLGSSEAVFLFRGLREED